MRFNHAKKNTIESELIRLTSLILLSSIILCTIISNKAVDSGKSVRSHSAGQKSKR